MHGTITVVASPSAVSSSNSTSTITG
jgi:hypothetical protein